MGLTGVAPVASVPATPNDCTIDGKLPYCSPVVRVLGNVGTLTQMMAMPGSKIG